MKSYTCPKCQDRNYLDELYAPFNCLKCKVVMEETPLTEVDGSNKSAMLDFSKGGKGFWVNDRNDIRLGTDLKQWQWTGKRWKKTI